MFKEHEQIVLTADVFGDEEEELKPGDVGAIIHIHPNEEAFVVEFMSLDWRDSCDRHCAAVTGASCNQRGPHTRENSAGSGLKRPAARVNLCAGGPCRKTCRP